MGPWPPSLPLLACFFVLVDMSLNSQDISRIAHLAKLHLSEAESAQMQTDLNAFFALVEQMNAVPTAGVQPLSHPVDALHDALPMALRLRTDAVSESNQRESNQRSAPAVERGLFLVPKVIE
jgi:aspartyl-tRNA(Asn)/glutamyl-tRNA(Gln) amidotransferase subunit C